MTLAFACAATGMWSKAFELCILTTDAALSDRLNVNGPNHRLAAEAYRFAAPCAACVRKGGVFSDGHSCIRLARTEWGQANHRVSGAILYNMLLCLQEALVCLCENDLDGCHQQLQQILMFRETYNTLRNLRILFGDASNDMFDASLISCHGLALALGEEDDVNSPVSLNGSAMLAQFKQNNLWGYCCTLIALALSFVRQGKPDDARMALTDCVQLSRSIGNKVIAVAAAVNLGLLGGKSSTVDVESSPIVDARTGWHFCIDPFAIVAPFRAEDG